MRTTRKELINRIKKTCTGYHAAYCDALGQNIIDRINRNDEMLSGHIISSAVWYAKEYGIKELLMTPDVDIVCN